ncbi:hypothetical protein CLV92_11859 [Kineococcus xinjiangensis]|uniref:Flp pilus-assembly TadE/G-like protein n=1 Tax=Kineococcus xinjiangensis TaxID=512762 RepID=A0A2S6ICS1_9ACTN|nr:hypothetical protein [Kineococcus xinjiangensis]PPK92015.1 hypothetical protein CLV92_11859 [Kineococcus xinjiangensis]
MTGAGSAAAGGADEGRILLLSLAYALIAVVLVLVVGAASAVHLQRKGVLALADAAAVDAADALDPAGYYAPDGGLGAVGVPLSDASVRASAEEFLERAAAAGAGGDVAVGEGTGSPDGRTAVVVLVARLEPPWASAGPLRLGEGFVVRVTSRAVARIP